MKKLSFIGTALACAVLLFSGCSSQGESAYLTVGAPAEIVFNADGSGGQRDVHIDTNRDWACTVNPSGGNGWLSVYSTAGQLILIPAAHDSTAAPDPVTIVITAGEAPQVVLTVRQLANEPVLTVTPAVAGIAFRADGTSDAQTTFTVATNESAWDVTLTPADSWLSVAKAGATFTLSAAPNPDTTAPDPVTVTVTAGGAAPVVIAATQEAAAVVVTGFAVGDPWPDDAAPEGVVFWLDPAHGDYNPAYKTGTKGLIVSLDESNNVWGSESIDTGATSKTNGATNIADIMQITEPYPAFHWCSDRGVRWYLPALYELEYLLCAFNGKEPGTWEVDDYEPAWAPGDAAAKAAFNAKMEAAGGTALSGGDYWTSTQHNNSYAITIDFTDGWTTVNTKGTACRVRAVKVFE